MPSATLLGTEAFRGFDHIGCRLAELNPTFREQSLSLPSFKDFFNEVKVEKALLPDDLIQVYPRETALCLI